MTLGPIGAALHAKARVAAHAMRTAVRRSALRVGAMTVTGAALAVATFLVSHAAFSFLLGLELVGSLLCARLLGFFFLVTFAMLVFSNVLIGFQVLYRSREADWWAVAPLRPSTVFTIRTIEVAVLASWAFLFLGLPVLVAYGVAANAPWPYHALLPIALALFVATANLSGTVLVMLLVRAFPGLDLKRLVALLAVAVAVLIGFTWRTLHEQGLPATTDVELLLAQALAGLGRGEPVVLPGIWLTRALVAAQDGHPFLALAFTSVLALAAGALALAARVVADKFLVESFQLLRGRGLGRPLRAVRRRSSRPPARGALWAVADKDVTLFFREPAQWSQVLLIGILAIVYVANLRNVPHGPRIAPWSSLAAHLNLGVLLLLLATLTTRFAFPLISMEGRRAWIVLLAPFPRQALLRQKFLLSLVVSTGVGTLGAVMSLRVLDAPMALRVTTHAAVLAGSLALSALAVGLGAVFPNFREDSPARVAAGFGGTLSFVLAVGYVAVVTALLALPSLWSGLGRLSSADLSHVLAWTRGAAVVLTVLVTAVPMALGRRHLEALET